MAEEYVRRIGYYCDIRMLEVRGEEAIDANERAYKILLDPAGRQLTSREFAALIEKARREALLELLFFVGGADGVSESARKKADLLLAISRLTLPHELARVVLAEQIYRAFTILHHHPYAREGQKAKTKSGRSPRR